MIDRFEDPATTYSPIRPGEQPHIIPQTFASGVAQLIYEAHKAIAVRNKQPVARKIEYHASELIRHLKSFNDLRALSQTDEILLRIETLRHDVRLVTRTKVRQQLGWVRRNFVEGLLWAVKKAGGRLTLNRRKEGGTLVDAIALLRPYLPKELRAGMSFATLRRICGSK